MPESQNIEYKQSWRDEYLKWICGFANATGGSIFIGKDDNGNIVGLTNAKKLLEDSHSGRYICRCSSHPLQQRQPVLEMFASGEHLV